MCKLCRFEEVSLLHVEGFLVLLEARMVGASSTGFVIRIFRVADFLNDALCFSDALVLIERPFETSATHTFFFGFSG